MAIKTVALSNFAKAGLNSDLMPFDLPPQFLTNIRNVRIIANKLSNYRGFAFWADLPDDFQPGYIMNVESTTGRFLLIAGKGTAGGPQGVVVFNGSTVSDISLAGSYASVTDVISWSGCMLSNIPVINNIGAYPQYWAPQTVGTDMALLPWDATDSWETADQGFGPGQRCHIMRSHKQFLFALNLVNGTQDIPDGVRWSAPADVDGLPPTWDPLDTTQLAGFTTLGSAGGAIVDGRSLRDSFIVYRESSISVFDYIGGVYVWQIRNLTANFGVLNADCIVEANGNHYFMSLNEIYVNDGNSITPLLHNKLVSRFSADFNKEFTENAFAVLYEPTDEIWFCIPSFAQQSTQYPYAAVAYVYNYVDDTWTVIDLPNGVVRSMCSGVYAVSQTDWGAEPPGTNAMGSWDQNPGPWNSSGSNPIERTLIGVQGIGEAPYGNPATGAIVVVDPKTAFTAAPANVVIERISLVLESATKVTTITRIYPHMTGSGKVYITLGSQDFPGSDIRWKDPVIFDAETDRKVDVRTTGEMHCFNITSVDPQQTQLWQLSGIDVEYVEAGVR